MNNKYQSWVLAALGQLSWDFFDGKFQPGNESDIKCHLYHSLLRTKAGRAGLEHVHVLTEFKAPYAQQRIDLALVKKTKAGHEPRLLIEIKETHKSDLPPEDIANRVRRDVAKLRQFKKNVDKSRAKFARHLRTPVVYFFFRGVRTAGIGMETNRKLEALQQKYTDVHLLWGPR